MRFIGSILLLLAVVLFYLSAMDRKTPLALSVVELDQALHYLPAYSLAGLLGLLFWAPPLVGRWLQRSTRPPLRQAGHRPAQDRARAGVEPLPFHPAGRPWREAILGRVRAFDPGAGARLLVDQSHGTPLTLLLEHLSPHHCEKAIGELGLLLQTIPLPPRLGIRFDQCPEGPAPRHHMVGRALGAVLDPGSFKAVATADQVDVLFLSPDPRWRTDW